MIASGTIIIDGQTYRKGDIIHDYGSGIGRILD